MLDLTNNLIAEFKDIATAAVVLVAIGMIIATWARTKAIVPTIGAIVFSGIVVWAVNNVDFIEEQVGEDIVEESGMPDPSRDWE